VGAPGLDTRRLAFGRVAELYDRARPSYPRQAIDDVIEFAAIKAPARVLEVGAGTGKATALLAERGFGVLALEPSAAMAAVARANCASYPAVEIVQSDFERWQARERFPAIVSAQAWHWVAPRTRYARAHEALVPGGALAALWTLPRWDAIGLRESLRAAYRDAAPALAPGFPMHPASEPAELAGDWQAEIDASEGFAEAQVRLHEWSCEYSAADYARLLQTHQDHILLERERRDALLAAITAVIEGSGGAIEMTYVTRVCLARRGGGG